MNVVYIHTPVGAIIAAELAVLPEDKRVGLAHRTHLGPNAGMLFDMGAPGRHYMWMANTLVALDMIFLDSSRRVVGIVSNAQPMHLFHYGRGFPPSRWVLEINGFTAPKFGIRQGSQLSW